jgi:hypothetical protein
VAYFKVNYLILALSSVAIAFITHPGSLFVLAALIASWLYVFVVRTGPLEINGRTLRCGRPPIARVGPGSTPMQQGRAPPCPTVLHPPALPPTPVSHPDCIHPRAQYSAACCRGKLHHCLSNGRQGSSPAANGGGGVPPPSLTSGPRPPCHPGCSEREKLMGMSALSFVVIFFLTRCATAALAACPRARRQGVGVCPRSRAGIMRAHTSPLR